MPDYSKTIIFTITCKDPTKEYFYVGHTVGLASKKNGMRVLLNSLNTSVRYEFLHKMIRDNGGFDNWEIQPLQEFSCNSKLQADIQCNRQRLYYANNNTFMYDEDVLI